MPANVRASMSALIALALLVTSARAAAPTPVDYTLDPTRSSLKFTFKQDRAENQGRFRKYDVVVRFSENNLPASKLDVTVQLDSLDTGDEQRDGEMKGENGFNVAKFPEAKFHASRISLVSVGRYEAIGKLTLHGVTRDIRVPLSFRTANESAGLRRGPRPVQSHRFHRQRSRREFRPALHGQSPGSCSGGAGRCSTCEDARKNQALGRPAVQLRGAQVVYRAH
jgi:polyisoprenoid-binding protein YceI